MKEYVETTETRTVTHLAGVKCDLCGKRSKTENWATKSFGENTVTIEMSLGNRFPDGGEKQHSIFDICPECFANKLVPWMKSQGAEPAVRNLDW